MATRAPMLEVVGGPDQRLRIPLDGDEIVLGRTVEGAGRLAGDPEISRRHARLLKLADGRLLIEDLGSTSGTIVNGIEIPGPTLLESGAELILGSTTLRVVEGEAPAPAPVERKPALQVVTGWAPGAIIPIGADPVALGRSGPSASALGDDPELADEHARVTPLADGGVMVEDLGTESGVRVAGRRIPGPTIVARGERFEIGRSTLEVVAVSAAATEPRAEADRASGGVQSIPGSLLALIATRAPVAREQVVRTAILALGWALAANLLIRIVAIEALDVSDDLSSLEPIPLILATVLPVAFNSLGFQKIFSRPDEQSIKRYLVPTFGVPALLVIANVARLSGADALDVLITVAVTTLPIAICATLLIRLRMRVSRETVAGTLDRG